VPPVFKTREDDPNGVSIPGGFLGPNGLGGVPLEDAARAGFRELTVTDELGYSIPDDDGNLQPLQGAELTAAGREVAEARGWQVVNVKAADLEPQPTEDGGVATYSQRELGLVADRPPAAEVAEQAYEDVYGGIEPLNTDEEAINEGPEAGDPRQEDSGAASRSPGQTDTDTIQEG
jgi:hypothetical protein